MKSDSCILQKIKKDMKRNMEVDVDKGAVPKVLDVLLYSFAVQLY